MLRRRWLLFPVAFLLALPTAFARDFFISPNGNDLNPGSLAEPWRTFTFAVSRLEAGDRLLVMEGTYREGNIRLSNSGTAEDPIVIQAIDGHEVWLKGSQVVPDWEPVREGVWVHRGWGVNSQQVFVNGKPLQQVGARSYLHSGETNRRPVVQQIGVNESSLYPGSFYAHPDGDLYCMLPDSGNPNDFVMEASTNNKGRVFHGGEETDYVHISGINFAHNNNTEETTFSEVFSFGRTGWVVENCGFYHSDHTNVIFRGIDSVLRDSVVIGGGVNAIMVHGSGTDAFVDGLPIDRNLLIERVTVRDSNYRRADTGWAAGGMKAIPNIRGLTVDTCVFENNNGSSAWWDESWGNNRVINSIFRHNQGSGVYVEVTHPIGDDPYSVLVENNRFYKNATQAIFISASSHVIVKYNTIANNRWAFYLGEQIRYNNTLSHNRFYRNLIVNQIYETEAMRWMEKLDTTVDNKVYDNFWASEMGGEEMWNRFIEQYPDGQIYYGRIWKWADESPVSDRTKWGPLEFVDFDAMDLRVASDGIERGYGWDAEL
jgi:hypothetical protein